MSDLITRLKGPPSVMAMRDAADEIARLQHDLAEYMRIANVEAQGHTQALERVKALEDALRPFAKDAAEWIHVKNDYRPKFSQLAGDLDEAKFIVGDLRRAAALLEKK